ncbi:MAG: (Fe-S)-binding protein [Sedimenticola sp.]
MTQPRRYSDKPDKVYFFGTCLVDLLYPRAGLAGMQLLLHEGLEVIYPRNQSCCGQPAYNSGYRNEARAVARSQLACFAEDYPIIVPSGSCASMMHHNYPELFKGEADEHTACNFAARVYELTEFLTRVLKIELQDLGAPVKVALHTSCSARREMGVAGDHESLLRQLDNVELVEPSHKEECCGFGGTFAVKHPVISAAMVEDKADNIIAAGAEQLVTGDCGCLMNISGHMAYRNSGPEGKHIADFIWERTHAADD